MAAGIASIFRAPLGGAVLGVELRYRDDLEPDALMPSLFASVTGYLVYGSVDGFTPIFGNESAIAHAPVAMLLMVAEMTQNLAVVPPAMLAPAIASLIVGETSIYRSQLGTRTDQPALQ